LGKGMGNVKDNPGAPALKAPEEAATGNSRKVGAPRPAGGGAERFLSKEGKLKRSEKQRGTEKKPVTAIKEKTKKRY